MLVRQPLRCTEVPAIVTHWTTRLGLRSVLDREIDHPQPEPHDEDHIRLGIGNSVGRCVCHGRAPDDAYRLGPDSEPHEGVPQGKVIGPTALPSNVYPNTTRNYWVYVPAQ